MSRRRRPRVPPTYADRLERLVTVGRGHIDGPGLWHSAIRHDDGCPAIETQSLRDCRCEPWFGKPRKVE